MRLLVFEKINWNNYNNTNNTNSTNNNSNDNNNNNNNTARPFIAPPEHCSGPCSSNNIKPAFFLSSFPCPFFAFIPVLLVMAAIAIYLFLHNPHSAHCLSPFVLFRLGSNLSISPVASFVCPQHWQNLAYATPAFFHRLLCPFVPSTMTTFSNSTVTAFCLFVCLFVG